MVIFYKKWKKYNEFQLTKNKMDLNIRKMTNHPPSPEQIFKVVYFEINIYTHFKKFHAIYYSFFSERGIPVECNFKFSISKILWGEGFSLSASKSRFIFYNSFSLRLTENLHEQKHFHQRCASCFVYNIFL